MNASLDRPNMVIALRFDNAAEGDTFVAGIDRESGFLVELPEQLALHESLDVLLIEDDASASFAARVAQVFASEDAWATAFLVEDSTQPTRLLAEIRDRAAAEPTDSGAAGEVRGTSPIHRIKQMNPRQKSILALKAGRTERQILLRDNSPQVLQNLLNNPRIENEDVLQLARSAHSVAPLLQRIASDPRWNSNQEIMALIVRNPKTPPLLAARVLPKLRTSDLRMMAKMSGGLRETVRKAAWREYMKRTGQRI